MGIPKAAAIDYRQEAGRLLQIDPSGRKLGHEFTDRLTYLTPKRDALRRKNDFSNARTELEFSVATICDVLLENMFLMQGHMEESKALTTSTLQFRKTELEQARAKVPKSTPDERKMSYMIAVIEWAILDVNSSSMNVTGRNAWGQLLKINELMLTTPSPVRAKQVIPEEWVNRVERLMGMLKSGTAMAFELNGAQEEIDRITRAARTEIKQQLDTGTVKVEELDELAQKLLDRANSGRVPPERRDVLLWESEIIGNASSDFKWGGEKDFSRTYLNGRF
ncbi:MAG: hypothetical protein WC759_03510 [Candidatus Micrarchaeia archaeon]